MRRQLAIRADLRPKESFNGFITYLTELNHYPSRRWILEEIEEKSYPTDRDIDRLAEFVGLDPKILSARAYMPVDGLPNMRRFRQHALSWKFINLRRPRICPTCLAEDGFLQDELDLSLHVACMRHGTFLVERCPTCSAPLSWEKRSHVARCACGADLSSARVSAAPTDLLWLERLIAPDRRICQEDTSLRWLPHMTLNEAMALVRILGGFFIPRSLRPKTTNAALSDFGTAKEIVVRAATMLTHWPESLHEELGRLSYRALNLFDSCAAQKFGPSSDLCRLIRDGVSPVRRNRSLLNQLLAQVEQPSDYVWGAAASISSGIRLPKLRGLVSADTLRGRNVKIGKKTLTLVHAADLQTYVSQKKAPYFLTHEAAEFLNVWPTQLTSLARHGLLHPVNLHRHTFGYPKQECRELLENLKLLLVPGRATEGALCSLVSLTARIGPLPRVLKLVLSGAIPIVAYDESRQGLDAFTVSCSGTGALKRALLSERGLCSMTEAGQILVCSRAAVRPLAINGFINAELTLNGRIRGISYTSLKRFKARFITCGEIRKKCGLSGNEIVWHIRRNGLEPVRSAKDHRYNEPFWPRREATRIIAKWHRERPVAA
jgi:hypothetical protein